MNLQVDTRVSENMLCPSSRLNMEAILSKFRGVWQWRITLCYSSSLPYYKNKPPPPKHFNTTEAVSPFEPSIMPASLQGFTARKTNIDTKPFHSCSVLRIGDRWNKLWLRRGDSNRYHQQRAHTLTLAECAAVCMVFHLFPVQNYFRRNFIHRSDCVVISISILL